MIRICTNINTWKVICIDNLQSLWLRHVRSFFFVTKKRKVIKSSILPTHSTILKRPLMLFRYPVLRFILIKWSTLKLHNCQQSENTAAAMHWLSRVCYCETAGGRRWQSPLPALPLATQHRPRPCLYTANVRLDSCQAEYVDVDVRDRENVHISTFYFLDERWVRGSYFSISLKCLGLDLLKVEDNIFIWSDQIKLNSILYCFIRSS